MLGFILFIRYVFPYFKKMEINVKNFFLSMPLISACKILAPFEILCYQAS